MNTFVGLNVYVSNFLQSIRYSINVTFILNVSSV
jgi:hypothetical protein